MSKHEFGHWLKEAIESSEPFVELKGHDQVAVRLRLEKSPEPGLALRLVELATNGGPAVVRILRFADVEARPAAYPAALPFVPAVRAIVAQPRPGDGGLICYWFGADPSESLRSEDLDAIVRIIERTPGGAELAAEAASLIRRSRRAEGVKVAARLRGLRHRFLAALGRPGLRQLLSAFRPPTRRLEELKRIADRVIRDSEADGWSIVDRTGQGLGNVQVRVWRLEKAGRTRAVTLNALGPGGGVMLVDGGR
jgi:ribosomal protein S28E/S33